MAMDQLSDAGDRPWLTLSEAAERSGRHIGALRSLVRRKRIPARKGNAGAWLVQLPDRPQDDLGYARRTAIDHLGLTSSPAPEDPVAELLAEVAELRDQLGRARGRLEGQERLILRLETELALARRPWWRRLLLS
jgi:hypothetical protein